MPGLIWLLIAAVLGLAALLRRAFDGTATANREYSQHQRQKREELAAEVTRTDTIAIPSFDTMPVSYEYDLVGQYHFIAKEMKILFEQYKIDHPIGSIVIRYEGSLNDNRTRKLLETEADQYYAFKSSAPYCHAYGPYGQNYHLNYLDACILRSRLDAIRRGYAPDNVEYYIWDGWKAMKQQPYGRYSKVGEDKDIDWYTYSALHLYEYEESKNTLPNRYDLCDEYANADYAKKIIEKRLEKLARIQDRHNKICAADSNCVAAVKAYQQHKQIQEEQNR